MIIGAAVCPGAPFLIAGTADRVARRLRPVVDACAAVVSRLPAADAVLMITTAAPINATRRTPDSTTDVPADPAAPARVIPPGSIISSTPVRRSDLPAQRVVALPAGPAAGDQPDPGTLSAATMVGAQLLAGGNRTEPTTAFEIIRDPAGVALMLQDRVAATRRVAVLVIADGAACHGDHAPGRRDDRAAPFDEELGAALAAGDPAALAAATADHELASGLLAAVDPLTVLALLTAQQPPDRAELLYSAAPVGVGYLVASWLWDADR